MSVEHPRRITIERGGIDDQSSSRTQTRYEVGGVYRTTQAAVGANHQRQSVLLRSPNRRAHGAIRRVAEIGTQRRHCLTTALPPLPAGLTNGVARIGIKTRVPNG